MQPVWESERERTKQVGDFEVSQESLKDARQQFSERSQRSQAVDKAFRGPIPAEYETWEENPDSYDWPGVDTPTDTPRRAVHDFVTPKDRSRMASGELDDGVPGFGDLGLSPDADDHQPDFGKEREEARDSFLDNIGSLFK